MDKTKKFLNLADRYLVGGVNSPVRSFKYVGLQPLLINRGKKSKVYDYNNKEYVDFVLSWGAQILGHADHFVVKESKKRIGSGFSFGATNSGEAELAKEIASAIPFIEKTRFVNSGTEAVMSAIRLARAYTNRDIIIKFENAYHGHADYLLAKAGSGLATLGIPLSAGVPREFVKHTLVLPFGNKEALKAAFKKYKNRIAAVIIEPVGANYGVIRPDLNFLKILRVLTRKNKSLLIFDEVITGFRFLYGAAATYFKIEPDLICLGKIIGGGLPVGAYAGKEKIMNRLAPLGDVYQASTFGGHPLVMRAGLATLRRLKKNKAGYLRMEKLSEYLCKNLEKAASVSGIGLKIIRFDSLFSFKFKPEAKFAEFYKGMLKGGIFFAPSEFEANFLSFSHSKKDIDKTLTQAKKVFEKMERENAGKH